MKYTCRKVNLNSFNQLFISAIVLGLIFFKSDSGHFISNEKMVDTKTEKFLLEEIASGSLPKPVLLHFFDPFCPCSRATIMSFKNIVKKYDNKVDFFVVIPINGKKFAKNKYREHYGIDMPIILDEDGSLASKCDIYATPQAVLINKRGKPCYRNAFNGLSNCSKKKIYFAFEKENVSDYSGLIAISTADYPVNFCQEKNSIHLF